ncbi:type 1 periplasmic binding fold superfamily protein [Maribacter chungangensis]|uniref:Type 1 periplasmic binding fold superfamily protein n=1 Tax=Maribacter chungangensis TaxID=1069117 RepID=A0ABW3B998_9FLAO
MKTTKKVQTQMKLRKSLALLSIGLLTLACSNDDDNPDAVDEEEVITTMTITLSEGANTVTLQTRDLDGDGPNAPEITTGNLAANTTYTGAIVLLNETESPVEDITLEVAEEDDEHQFFFNASGAITSTAYADEDGDGNPLGLRFTLTTGDAGTGALQVTLRHEPKKPNDGTLADAGGETDIAQTFNVVVE